MRASCSLVSITAYNRCCVGRILKDCFRIAIEINEHSRHEVLLSCGSNPAQRIPGKGGARPSVYPNVTSDIWVFTTALTQEAPFAECRDPAICDCQPRLAASPAL